MNDYELIDNTQDRQYEFHIGEMTPYIEYIKTQNGQIHLKGKGIGSRLVEKTLRDIERQGLELVPLCPFVAGYIKRHPEWKRIVMQGINIE